MLARAESMLNIEVFALLAGRHLSLACFCATIAESSDAVWVCVCSYLRRLRTQDGPQIGCSASAFIERVPAQLENMLPCAVIFSPNDDAHTPFYTDRMLSRCRDAHRKTYAHAICTVSACVFVCVSRCYFIFALFGNFFGIRNLPGAQSANYFL